MMSFIGLVPALAGCVVLSGITLCVELFLTKRKVALVSHVAGWIALTACLHGGFYLLGVVLS